MPTETIKGMRELSRKLKKLGAVGGSKVLRSAAMNAATPVVRAAKLRVPVGDEAHRTRDGNVVTPGFARRSIRKRSKIKEGRATVTIGVLSEAYYALIPESGPHTVSARRGKAIQPYTIDRNNWLSDSFINQRSAVEKRLADQLRKKILKAAR